MAMTAGTRNIAAKNGISLSSLRQVSFAWSRDGKGQSFHGRDQLCVDARSIAANK